MRPSRWGWSGYAAGFLTSIGLDLPVALLNGPHVAGGVFNVPAALIVFAVAGMLLVGTREERNGEQHPRHRESDRAAPCS